MCERKTVLISVSLILPVAASFCINQTHKENELGHQNKIKSENEYKMYCLNGGKRYYLVDEGFVGCNYTWLFGGKRCEK